MISGMNQILRRIAPFFLYIILLSGISHGSAHAGPQEQGGSVISEQQIRYTIQDLAAFGTRHAMSAQAGDAADYLKARLGEIGCPAFDDAFTYRGAAMRNIVCTLPNSNQQAARLIILGAHYDSIVDETDDPDAPAPGADDNASGVAATLAAAAELARTPLPGAEVRIVFFTAEEIGMGGSKHYVNDVLKEEQRPVAAIITDYIGTDTGADGVMLLYDKRSEKLQRRIETCAHGTQPDLHVWSMRSDMLKTFGDYKAFWDAGRAAVMLVREFKAGITEYAHTPQDTPDKLRMSQVVKIADLIYGVVLDLAGPQQ
jgi:hypothetical protein